MIKLNLPFPPSSNTYYRSVKGRVLISKKGRIYKDTVARIVAWQKAAHGLEGRLKVQVLLFPPDRRKRDLDNSLKALVDSLEGAGVFVNDSQIDELIIKRMEVTSGGIAEVTVTEL